MQSIGRNKITSLRPLTQQLIDYFHSNGGQVAVDQFQSDTVWWRNYFGHVDNDPHSPTYGQALNMPIPFDLWEDPGADISDKYAYRGWVESLAHELDRARKSRSIGQQLVQKGSWPPITAKDPFAIPDYFFWWQAENAFRRGFMALYEQSFLDAFKKSFKEAVVNSGNMLTAASMQQLADDYERDPFIANYLEEVGDELEQKNLGRFNKIPTGPNGNPSLRAIYDNMVKERQRAYQQFSPYFQPLRWVPGGGLVGIELE
jgi:hypothetical protein